MDKLAGEDSISLDWGSRYLVPGCTHSADSSPLSVRRACPYLHIYCISISLTATCAVSCTFWTAVLALLADCHRRTWVNNTLIVVEVDRGAGGQKASGLLTRILFVVRNVDQRALGTSSVDILR